MTRETYAEAGVKQRATFKTTGIRVALILGILITLPLSRIAGFLYIVPTIMLILTFWLYPRMSFEYEYIYVDGQIDFDRIMGGAKRKTMMRVDLENVEIVAPAESDELLMYSHKENMVVKDYSSMQPQNKKYALITAPEGKYTKIIFEPSEKMLDCMKSKYPRKVNL